ncbi:transglycosylase SLT domain-containing protein [Paraburkholderia sp. Ac-20336]|uniref:lytic transglycosylase domain-containing protein n=1 Tax=Burkholderiaceae TaxID=119060 RepID=UPI00141E179C|nr:MULTISPECIES: transglycosylase SLT domain-containing protein [Burkholderiaceae]MBN3804284.1 transglycosylase SLT domain-containing protein [Paraburkholderia sp. Ac-20336]NIF52492.1 transglycosylase SLT domain-containing protein [Burkholderia sp. Ax-1724]
MQHRKFAFLTPCLRSRLIQIAMLYAIPAITHADCIDDAASFQHVNVGLMRAIAQVESGTQTHVINRNSDGTFDIGLMQINSSWLPRLAREGISEQSLFDPCTNAYVGAWILAENIRQYGPTWSAIGAYNASSPEKRLAYARKVYATAQSIASSPDSPMPILPPSYVPPETYNPFAPLEVNQVKMSAPRGVQAAPAPATAASAVAPATPGSYNFGWTITGADAAKPVQVFDDGTKVYVQFGDLKHVPAIFADTPRGRVVLRWEAQPPYAIISSPERKLIFQIGSAEAIAQRTAVGAATGTATAQAQAMAASAAGVVAASKTAAARGAAGASTDALWYITTSSTAKTAPIPAATLPAPQATMGTPQALPMSAQQTAPQAAQRTDASHMPASKPQVTAPGTSALWYVTK